MKIIKKGTEIPQVKQFTCHHCWSIFEAEKGEWIPANQMESMHDGIESKCKCPVCGQMAYK